MHNDYTSYLKSLRTYYQRCTKLSEKFSNSFQTAAADLVELANAIRDSPPTERAHMKQPTISLSNNLKIFAASLSQITCAIGDALLVAMDQSIAIQVISAYSNEYIKNSKTANYPSVQQAANCDFLLNANAFERDRFNTFGNLLKITSKSFTFLGAKTIECGGNLTKMNALCIKQEFPITDLCTRFNYMDYGKGRQATDILKLPQTKLKAFQNWCSLTPEQKLIENRENWLKTHKINGKSLINTESLRRAKSQPKKIPIKAKSNNNSLRSNSINSRPVYNNSLTQTNDKEGTKYCTELEYGYRNNRIPMAATISNPTIHVNPYNKMHKTYPQPIKSTSQTNYIEQENNFKQTNTNNEKEDSFDEEKVKKEIEKKMPKDDKYYKIIPSKLDDDSYINEFKNNREKSEYRPKSGERRSNNRSNKYIEEKDHDYDYDYDNDYDYEDINRKHSNSRHKHHNRHRRSHRSSKNYDSIHKSSRAYDSNNSDDTISNDKNNNDNDNITNKAPEVSLENNNAEESEKKLSKIDNKDENKDEKKKEKDSENIFDLDNSDNTKNVKQENERIDIKSTETEKPKQDKPNTKKETKAEVIDFDLSISSQTTELSISIENKKSNINTNNTSKLKEKEENKEKSESNDNEAEPIIENKTVNKENDVLILDESTDISIEAATSKEEPTKKTVTENPQISKPSTKLPYSFTSISQPQKKSTVDILGLKKPEPLTREKQINAGMSMDDIINSDKDFFNQYTTPDATTSQKPTTVKHNSTTSQPQTQRVQISSPSGDDDSTSLSKNETSASVVNIPKPTEITSQEKQQQNTNNNINLDFDNIDDISDINKSIKISSNKANNTIKQNKEDKNKIDLGLNSDLSFNFSDVSFTNDKKNNVINNNNITKTRNNKQAPQNIGIDDLSLEGSDLSNGFDFDIDISPSTQKKINKSDNKSKNLNSLYKDLF